MNAGAIARRKQRGVALVTAMVLMTAVLIVGFSSVRAALGDAQSARHERDRQTALRAAEAALLDAERELDTTPASAPRFAALAGAGFVDGCGKAGTDSHGLCTRLSPPSWQTIDLAGDDASLVTFGTFSLRDFGGGGGGGAALAPRYLIELIPLNPAYGRFYRITALGFGQRASMRVVLQSFYHVVPAAGAGPPSPSAPPAEAPAAPPDEPPTEPPTESPAAASAPSPAAVPVASPGLPARRIGWREVANWPALHAAANP